MVTGDNLMFAGKLGFPELIVLLGFFLLVALWAQIFHKAGYSRSLVVLMFVPLLNVVVFLWFAFSEWPIETEFERLRMNQSKPQH
jgi:hypothetical protein